MRVLIHSLLFIVLCSSIVLVDAFTTTMNNGTKKQNQEIIIEPGLKVLYHNPKENKNDSDPDKYYISSICEIQSRRFVNLFISNTGNQTNFRKSCKFIVTANLSVFVLCLYCQYANLHVFVLCLYCHYANLHVFVLCLN